MSEELLKELLEEMKKHNEIQESIKCEMKLQNDLMVYDMEENKGNSIIDIEEIKKSAYEGLRQKKKSDVKTSSGGYLDSNFNELLNAMREGFEEGTRNESITSLCETVISMVKSGVLTNEDAQFIVLTTGRNCKPPMPDEEIETCWNSITRKENEKEVLNSNNSVFNDYLTFVHKELKKDEGEKSITELSERLEKDLHKGNISERHAVYVLENAGVQCTPPIPRNQVYQIWCKILLREKRKRGEEIDVYLELME